MVHETVDYLDCCSGSRTTSAQRHWLRCFRAVRTGAPSNKRLMKAHGVYTSCVTTRFCCIKNNNRHHANALHVIHHTECESGYVEVDIKHASFRGGHLFLTCSQLSNTTKHADLRTLSYIAPIATASLLLDAWCVIRDPPKE